MTMIRYNFPTTIHFGAGARRMLPDVLKQAKTKRPLIVTDKGLASLPIISEMQSMLRSSELHAEVFGGIWGNPVESQVTAGVKAFHAGKHDAIVAVGGGAALDVAKVIALMAFHPGSLFDYEDDKPGALPVDQPIPYIVALPTTAGTGSEVGRSSVVSDDTTHAKKIIFSPRLMPCVVLEDPELTLGLPAQITASTGMDALTHLIEAYLVKSFHPMCDGIALEGLRLVAKSLKPAVEFARAGAAASPEHVQVRGWMLNASMMGAVAFQKGLGVTHSCAHALSTVCDLHHGTANAVMLPVCMNFNMPVARDKFVMMAQAVGAKSLTPEGFVQWIVDLKRDIGMPMNLRELGVSRSQIGALVDVAILDVCHGNNPQKVTADHFRQLFEEAFRD